MNRPEGSFGRHQLLRRLDRGDEGVVWHAFDPLLRRDVAIRILKSWTDLRPEERRRRTMELRHRTRIEHDHLVPVFEVHLDHDPPWIVERFLPGGPLAKHGEPQARDAATALALPRQIAPALMSIHRRGFSHGDIGPTSILRDLAGNLFLTALPRSLFEAGSIPAPDSRPDRREDWATLARLARALWPREGGELPRALRELQNRVAED